MRPGARKSFQVIPVDPDRLIRQISPQDAAVQAEDGQVIRFIHGHGSLYDPLVIKQTALPEQGEECRIALHSVGLLLEFPHGAVIPSALFEPI